MTRPNVVNVVGGLGNQLFQYMFGLALEARTGRPTVFDVSDYGWYDLHEGLIAEEYFEIELPRARREQAPLLARHRLAKKVIGRLGPFSLARSDQSYDFTAASPRDRAAYFRGYWQDLDYGQEMMARIRDTLRFRGTLLGAIDAAWAVLSPPKSAACIQIRRGDYAKLPPSAPQYPLPMTYFSRAMDIMHAETGVQTFYIFSDDIAGVRQDLSSKYELVFVEPTISGSAGSDLGLMTRFSHHIMSNSTFGWWGALLRRDASGLVLTPRPWLNPRWRGDATLYPRLQPGWREIDVPLS